MKPEELSEEDFILKWGFIRQTPLFEEFKRDLDYQFKSRVNAISDEIVEKHVNSHIGIFDRKIGFRKGIFWLKEQLLKQ